MVEEVILVDENDHETGRMEKLAAHEQGLLHRAISVFIYNSAGEMLLQKRASGKYHSAGLWTNTCCSHPRPGEPVADAARRRLQEEMGMKAELQFRKSFVYRSEFENGLTEHEFDHVFTGTSDETPSPDPAEVGDYKWMKKEDILREVAAHPEQFTTWFRIALREIV